MQVKPGAVDIVRHWQELGYIIIYVTGRPDMQLQRVVSWLAQVSKYLLFINGLFKIPVQIISRGTRCHMGKDIPGPGNR